MEEEQESNSKGQVFHQTMDDYKEQLSSQIYRTKIQRIYYDFDTDISRRNNSHKITVSSSTHHVKSGNGGHVGGGDCDNNGDFGIGDNDDDVGNEDVGYYVDD